LARLSNDIAPWLDFEQSEILLSRFSNDLDFHIDNIEEAILEAVSNLPLSYFSNDLIIGSVDVAEYLRITPNVSINNLSVLSNIVVGNDSHFLGKVFGSPTTGLQFESESRFNGPISSYMGADMYAGINIRDDPSNLFSTGVWTINSTSTLTTSDLVFSSRGNIVTSFTDSFDPSIINFTGQHRCTGRFPKTDINDLVGKIVVSTGEYSDLNNDTTLSINEAIPIVKLCQNENDKRCFGVISDRENDDKHRDFNLGHIKFHIKKNRKNQKFMINAVGEGGIWICNINGNLENGDYISSSRLPGFGMKQYGDTYTNYTVAKITCDCNFSNLPKTISQKDITYKNRIYKTAFVGCIYKF
jgi:hypothetical protein